MSCFIIVYDLKNGSSEDYSELHEKIKSYGTWAKISESCWAIVTDGQSTDVRDNLKSCLDVNDRLFVTKSSGIAAWSNVICKSEWLKDNL